MAMPIDPTCARIEGYVNFIYNMYTLLLCDIQPTPSPSQAPTPKPTSPTTKPPTTKPPTKLLTKTPTSPPTPPPTASPSSNPSNNPSESPSRNPTEPPSTVPTMAPICTNSNLDSFECACNNGLDLIFVVDSSGSVYDANYTNWQLEIDAMRYIVNSSLPKTKTRVGLINFSGCGSTFSVEQCRYSENRLKKEFGLNAYGSPHNDLQAVYNRISQMSSADFHGGYTWTNEALQIALTEFQLIHLQMPPKQ